MKDPVSPQDGTPELKDHLNKSGIKVPERKRKIKDQDTIGRVNGSVQVNNNSNPNSRSSYTGIFG